MTLPPWLTWYAPICCVIPPASPVTTRELRIASNNVVLPWSTCPMIVTTGGRFSKSSSESSITIFSNSVTSVKILSFTSNPASSANNSTVSRSNVWLTVAIIPSINNCLTISPVDFPRRSAKSPTVNSSL